jgi:hypothetical protein
MKGFLSIQMVDSDQQKGPSSNGPLFHVGGEYALKYKGKKTFRVLYDMLLRGKHLTPVMDC